MKTALICIAKNEDNYIDEWADYHLKIGFDEIFIYQNNWRYNNVFLKNITDVHLIEFDGYAKQLLAYNDFIKNRSFGFDFAAFFDVDEFLNIGDKENIQQLLNCDVCKNNNCIAFNWRIFGDNGLKTVDNNNFSCISRFTKCSKTLNKHVKCIINLSKCRNIVKIVNPHYTNLLSITIDNHQFNGPFFERNNEDICNGIYLNHYYSKTFDEWKKIKAHRGSADRNINDSQYYIHNNINLFKGFSMQNDIVDMTLFNKYVKLTK